MTIDEKIKVMTAYREGKEIEIKGNEIANWTTCIEPNFNFQIYEYRIKQKEKPFEWNIDNAEVLLGKIIKFKEHIAIILNISKLYIHTIEINFSLVEPNPDLKIKINNNWILFKDYKPE